MTEGKVLAVISGGLDSTTLVYDLLSQGYEVDMISFNYGQRHKKELAFARTTAQKLGLQHDIVDLSGITHLISNSSLTGDEVTHIEVPEGHYAEDNMKQTVVPNRNMIMLSIAAGVAVNRKMDFIATAVHGGDHFIYPDCRPRFIRTANAAIVTGNSGFGSIPEQQEGAEVTQFILTPYLNKSKADIAYRALELDVPLHMTWSCYKGGQNHCGRCGTCVERLEAIATAQQLMTVDRNWASMKDGIASRLIDYTVYDDIEFWKVAVREAKV